MANITAQELARAKQVLDYVGEICTLTFVKALDKDQVLRRIGSYPDTEAEDVYDDLKAPDGEHSIVCVTSVGQWCVLLEPYGFELASGALLGEVSRGTEAMSLLRHDYASPSFTYAIDGTVAASFDPGWPGDIWGTDPGRVREALHEVGLLPANEAEDEGEGDRILVARCLAAITRLTGVELTLEALSEPMVSAEFETWFTPPVRGNLLHPGNSYNTPQSHALATAVLAASPSACRAATVAEVRRVADEIGIAGTPGLEEALTAAASGQPPTITIDSPLGGYIRKWLSAAKAARPYSGSSRFSEDEKKMIRSRERLAEMLHGALHHDAQRGAQSTLFWVDGEPEAYEAALRTLRQDG